MHAIPMIKIVCLFLPSIKIKAQYANQPNGQTSEQLSDDIPEHLPDKAGAVRAEAARAVRAYSCKNFVHRASS